MAPASLLLLHGLSTHDWLLRHVLDFLEADDDDVYRLWLVAVDDPRLVPLRTVLATPLPSSLAQPPRVSLARARLLAMVHANWTALFLISKHNPSPQLSRYTVGRILHELARLPTTTPWRPHPHRELALRVAAAPRSVPAFVMYVAAAQGQLESVVYLHHVATYDPPEALDAAARAGHADVVSWLLDNAHTATWVTAQCCVVPTYQYRHDPELGVMAWQVHGTAFDGLYAMTKKWGYDSCTATGSTHVYPVMDLAAKHGDLRDLYCVSRHALFQRAFSLRAVENAAAAGHLSAVQWLLATYLDAFTDSKALRRALVNGHLDIAQWLDASNVGGYIKTSTFAKVAKRGRLDVLQWMMKTFPTLVPPQQPYVGLITVAANEGHAHIVEWLIQEKGHTVGVDVVHGAVKSGDVAFAQWLVAHCSEPLSLTLHNSAVISGSSAMVRWVVDDLQLWSKEGLRFATHCDSTDMAELVYADAIARAQRLGKPLEKLAHVQGSQWFLNGWFDTFAWLLEHGYRRNLFRNETHFKSIDYVDRWYATKHESLGWENELLRRSQWPKTPASIRRMREVLELFIDVYDVAFVCGIPWFPAWAVRNNKFKSLRRLADIEHPQVATRKSARLLLRESRKDAMVQWFFEQYPSLFTTAVVRWAVEHDKRACLEWVFETFLPTHAPPDTHKLPFIYQCLRTAAWSAAKHDRQDIIQILLLRWAKESDSTWLWRGLRKPEREQTNMDMDVVDD